MSDLTPGASAGAPHGTGRKVDPNDFPHPPTSAGRHPPPTIENLEHLLAQGDFSVRFNEIKKRTEMRHADGRAASMNEVVSFALRHGFGTGWIYQFVDEIAGRRRYNPVKEWILSIPWDQQDRLADLYDTIIPTDDYPEGLKDILLHRWLLSACQTASQQVHKPRSYNTFR